MNQADSAYLINLLRNAGYQETEQLEEAQVIIFNTCSVRQHAEERLFQHLKALSPLKVKKNPIIGLVGCVPALYREKLFGQFPFIDFLAGPESLAEVPLLISRSKEGVKSAVFVSQGTTHFAYHQALKGNLCAFLPIICGCNNFCSYCVVPYVREKEKSRPAEQILAEANEMIRQGIREITLLGQNVNSYRDGEIDFPLILKKVAALPGLLRLGFLTSHPKDISLQLFRVMADSKKIYRHLHLPLQSGSDKILLLMNRRYTINHYLKIIEEARRFIPSLTITSDIIVGFPGETESDFEETLNLIKKVEFDDLFAFKYSDRPKTAAEKLEPKISPQVKEQRLAKLWEVQDAISLRLNQAMVGKESEVLLLSKSCKNPGYLIGKTEKEKKVLVEGPPELVGRLVPVRITSADRQLLYGKPV